MKEFISNNIEGLTIFLTIVIAAMPIYFKLADNHEEKRQRVDHLPFKSEIKKILLLWPYPTLAGVVYITVMIFSGWVFLKREKQNKEEVALMQKAYTDSLQANHMQTIELLAKYNIQVSESEGKILNKMDTMKDKRRSILVPCNDHISFRNNGDNVTLVTCFENSFPEIPVHIEHLRSYVFLQKGKTLYSNYVGGMLDFAAEFNNVEITKPYDYITNINTLGHLPIALQSDTMVVYTIGSYDGKRFEWMWFWEPSLQRGLLMTDEPWGAWVRNFALPKIPKIK